VTAAIGFLLSFYTNPWIAQVGYASAYGTVSGRSPFNQSILKNYSSCRWEPFLESYCLAGFLSISGESVFDTLLGSGRLLSMPIGARTERLESREFGTLEEKSKVVTK